MIMKALPPPFRGVKAFVIMVSGRESPLGAGAERDTGAKRDTGGKA